MARLPTVFRSLVVLLGLSLVLLSGAPVGAAPKDAEARRTISKTMDQYAEDTNADKVEQAMMTTIGSCGSADCDPKVVALAWMYIGLVHGGAKDWDTAREAFTVALGFDPKVKLDPRFSSPTAQALFDGVKAKVAPAEPAPDRPAQLSLGSQLKCEPLIKEVESLRPVPLRCTTANANVTQVAALYRQYGVEKLSRSDLRKVGDAFEGEIPCAELPRPGVWGMYFEARNKRGDLQDTVGSVQRPVVFKVVKETSEPAPALPGKPAPDRCNASSYCPEDMVGTPACDAFMSQGAAPTKTLSCDEATSCDWGMECRKGTCEPSGLCSSNRDCKLGSLCQNGRCALDLSRAAPPGEDDDAGLRDWFGLHFAMDFTSLSAAENVCSANGGYSCFDGDAAYRGTPHPDGAGAVGAGFHSSTMRALLTYERFVTNQVSLGARFGFAFKGAPEDFFPLHFEARGSYYFGQIPESRTFLVPYVALGVGAAQIDSKASATIVACNPGREPECTAAPLNTGLLDPMTGAARQRTIDAYKTLGKFFVVLSPGARFLLTDNLAAVANVGVVLMTDSTSVFFTVQPSLGATYGF